MKRSREEILNRIRMTLHAVAPDARALLYGSRARGDSREDSDWDILILIDKDRVEGGDYDAIAYPLFELGWELDEAISPVLYTEKDWQRYSFTPFHHNVEQEGMRL